VSNQCYDIAYTFRGTTSNIPSSHIACSKSYRKRLNKLDDVTEGGVIGDRLVTICEKRKRRFKMIG
jgi:hypothetical protein